jgi:hypothetical protein
MVGLRRLIWDLGVKVLRSKKQDKSRPAGEEGKKIQVGIGQEINLTSYRKKNNTGRGSFSD